MLGSEMVVLLGKAMQEAVAWHTDELVSKSEGKQAKSQSFLFPRTFKQSVSRRCEPDLGWFFTPQMIQSRKFLTELDFWCGQVDSQD